MATKKAKKVKTQMEKEADFKKAATKRANSALRQIELLAKLANPNKYAWTPAQLEKIGAGFQKALDGLKAAFAGKVTQGGIEL